MKCLLFLGLIYFLFHSLSFSLVSTYVADGQQLISFPFPLLLLPSFPYGAYAQQPRKLLSLLAICPVLFACTSDNFRLQRRACANSYYIQSVLSQLVYKPGRHLECAGLVRSLTLATRQLLVLLIR